MKMMPDRGGTSLGLGSLARAKISRKARSRLKPFDSRFYNYEAQAQTMLDGNFCRLWLRPGSTIKNSSLGSKKLSHSISTAGQSWKGFWRFKVVSSILESSSFFCSKFFWGKNWGGGGLKPKSCKSGFLVLGLIISPFKASTIELRNELSKSFGALETDLETKPEVSF